MALLRLLRLIFLWGGLCLLGKTDKAAKAVIFCIPGSFTVDHDFWFFFGCFLLAEVDAAESMPFLEELCRLMNFTSFPWMHYHRSPLLLCHGCFHAVGGLQMGLESRKTLRQTGQGQLDSKPIGPTRVSQNFPILPEGETDKKATDPLSRPPEHFNDPHVKIPAPWAEPGLRLPPWRLLQDRVARRTAES